jgi:hypothetical protein
MGLVFLAAQSFEYKAHWKTLTPITDSYGSIFYTITTFHAAHVIMGILMLSYLAILPKYGPSKLPPTPPVSCRFSVLALRRCHLALRRLTAVHHPALSVLWPLI